MTPLASPSKIAIQKPWKSRKAYNAYKDYPRYTESIAVTFPIKKWLKEFGLKHYNISCNKVIKFLIQEYLKNKKKKKENEPV